MERYKRLTQNTIIFFVGEMVTKVAAFFMLRYYTGILTTSEYGFVDLIITTATFLMPLITLGINEGVFRFSMERGIDRSKVLGIGIVITVTGNLILLLLVSTIELKYELWDYKLLIWLVCFTSGMKTIVVSYCRGIERSRLYAAAGVIQSVIQIFAAIALISGMKLRVEGYIYATAIANALTVVIVSIGMRREFRFKLRVDRELLRQMLIYSLPLIVNIICWLVMSSIDKYVILYQLTTSDNGMYSAAGKIPMLITTVSAIFLRAWQLSSVTESEAIDKAAFYSKIFQLMHITLALTSMVLLILIRPIYDILVGEAFSGCWQFTPFLIMSAIFSCFASFLGTNYVTMKETKGAVYTSASAAVINLILNIVLTRRFGINGTAFATMISYIILWIFIKFNTAKFVKIHIDYKKFFATYLLVLIQAFIIASGRTLYYVQAALLVLMVAMNFKDIVTVYKKVVMQLRQMV